MPAVRNAGYPPPAMVDEPSADSIEAVRPKSRVGRVLAVIGHAATGLVLHGLRRPFAPALIDARTGRVAPR